MEELLGKKIVLPNDISADDYRNEVTEGKENEPFVNRDEENVDHKRLEERNLVNVENKTGDKIVPETEPVDAKDMRDGAMYMQVPSQTGKEDEVDKRMNVTAIVALLQAIFAMLLVSGKTLHEQSLLITRLLSQHSLLSQLEASLSPSSLCTCQAEPRVCCEVTTAFINKMSGMVDKVSTVVVLFKQLCSALYRARERVVWAANLLGRVRIQLQPED